MAGTDKQHVAVAASLQNFKPMADRSWRITFDTRELSGEEVKILADNFQGEGWLLFSPNELSVSDIPEEQAESGVKTPHQRLRSRMYILWKQQGSKGDFDSYYRTSMERLIDIVSEKLKEDT